MSLTPVTRNFASVVRRVFRDRVVFSGAASSRFASSNCFRVGDAKTRKRSRLPTSVICKVIAVWSAAPQITLFFPCLFLDIYCNVKETRMGQKKRLLHELPYTESENSGTIIHAYILLPMLCSLTGCYVQKSIFLCKTFICTHFFSISWTKMQKSNGFQLQGILAFNK